MRFILILLFVVLAATVPVHAAGQDASATVSTGQVALSTSAGQIVVADQYRRSVLIRNLDAAITIYIGVAGVTSSTGLPAKAGDSITINTRAAIYAVAASGTPTAAYLTEGN